jgi:hypothetical protein
MLYWTVVARLSRKTGKPIVEVMQVTKDDAPPGVSLFAHRWEAVADYRARA